MMTIDRPQRPHERELKAPKVAAKVRGWNDTHVLFDTYINGRLFRSFVSRPIERFMVDFAL